jgi:hypothetical protein
LFIYWTGDSYRNECPQTIVYSGLGPSTCDQRGPHRNYTTYSQNNSESKWEETVFSIFLSKECSEAQYYLMPLLCQGFTYVTSNLSDKALNRHQHPYFTEEKTEIQIE